MCLSGREHQLLQKSPVCQFVIRRIRHCVRQDDGGGCIGYWRSCPIFWRSNRQGVRAYSTAESEYIAASDSIVCSELHDFMEFFSPLPQTLAFEENGIAPSLSNAILWLDNTSAISTAKSDETRPKSRHYALRYLRVKESARAIVFCPTNLMKADALTKT